MTDPALPPQISGALTRYRVMATVVGVLLIVLILIGVPLANFDGTEMWGVFGSTPEVFPVDSELHSIGEFITTVLGIAHGYLYMIFLVMAFLLSRRAKWPIGFTLVTLLCGTVPILSFWAERRATRRVHADHARAPASSSSTATAR